MAGFLKTRKLLSMITKPTLLLNEAQAQANIQRMVDKAHHQQISLRPHFKTHQSVAVGEYFRQAGVSAITVSSLDMAQYFAEAGWDDITIAFPLNLRQLNEIAKLAQHITLGILVDSVDFLAYSHEGLAKSLNVLNVWIEIDEGTGRTGIPWQREEEILYLIEAVQSCENLHLRGLLTHSGRVYAASSTAEIRQIYCQTTERLNVLRQSMLKQGIALQVSTGDTPGCVLANDLGDVDEIRPGNFVFFDVQQLQMGVCLPQEIALAVACPVVGIYPERCEVAIYGGAVHLSKDRAIVNGQVTYGLVAFASSRGWGKPVPGAYVTRLTQEHGVVSIPESCLYQIQLGDLLYVLPAHSCLAVSALSEYRTLDGKILETMP